MDLVAAILDGLIRGLPIGVLLALVIVGMFYIFDKTVKIGSHFRNAIKGLIKFGEYKLAIRMVLMEVKIARLTRSKARYLRLKDKHERRWKKTSEKATLLHEEMAQATAEYLASHFNAEERNK